jgi:ATP-dependent Lhr-like helicase
MTADVLDRFSPATREWFRSNFAAPTAAQAGAWDAISSGRHTLVVAPTGSGKTLSAFLWALDRLATEPVPEKARRCRVLYISPLKALAVDVERNLRSPLVGIGHAAARLGLPGPDVRVAVRSGDTPADERRAFAREPADILITTPESLFLLLTSAARDALRSVETVIIDEVHAVAGTKRGAHLALSLERLDALLDRSAQRIGLSATVRPVGEVARFLAGGRDVAIVAPPSEKKWSLDVVVPVPDLGAIGQPTGDLSGPAAGDPERSSIWPHVEERIVDQIAEHSSTLVFVNSRRLAERLTARLNEIWVERLEQTSAPEKPPTTITEEPATRRAGTELATLRDGPFASSRASSGTVIGARASSGTGATRAPAQVMAQSAIAQGAPPVLARAHHGSVSREQRQLTEEDLKAGRLPAVVATSSLELGIDMGAVDLVVQVEAPPSVASGLQRVGRAGHQVGAVSHGVLFPKFRGDLVQTAVIVERMRAGAIEALRIPANPLDVLAQQVVAMVALDDWTVTDLEALVRRAAPFSGLTRGVLESVLDMLSGRYPSDEFAELRPRLVWDRTTGTLTGRRGAQRLAVTSGGTIPDRGLYGVFLAGEGEGRRVGELDEEMVYESRVGDVFALGTSTWRIEDITHDRVLVTPAPGTPARLPFWKGDSLGRPAELGAAVGAFVREVAALSPAKARARVQSSGLDDWAADNLLGYLAEQSEAIGRLPHDRQIVVERFRDEIGDWRVVVHSPFGAQVHAPWSLVVAARLRERYGVDVQAMHADDGLVFRLPDTDWLAGETAEIGAQALRDAAPVPHEAPQGPSLADRTLRSPRGTPPEQRSLRSRRGTSRRHEGPSSPMDELLELIFPDPDEVAAAVTEQIGGSALFASRFRECAGRALLLPKRRPDRRQALWQQRLRASQLLEVASQYPSFPIVLEAVRECVNDVFDVPGLVELLRGVRSRTIATVAVETPHPSPFASSLMFGYVAQFLYEGDSPLAERRAAALSLDPSLLAELLGTTEGLSLAELLDPDALTRTERELQHLMDGRRARDADDLSDVLRQIGPLTTAAVQARCAEPDAAVGWLAELVRQRRVLELPGVHGSRWAVIEDAGRLRDALGVALPVGVPEALLVPVPDPLGDLLARYARSHTVFTAGEAATWLGIGGSVARDVLRRLVASGRLVEGDLRPPGWLPPSEDAALRDARSFASSGPHSSGTDTGVAPAPPPHPDDPPPHPEDPTHPPVPEAPRRAATDEPQFCDAQVLRLLRRRSLAALREAVEPVGALDYARFLPAWQGVGELRGVDGVLRAVEQLAGVPVPASALESLILPARVRDYHPSLLDELTSSGEVVWQGHGALAGTDGWVSLHPAELAPLTLADPQPVPDGLGAAVLETIGAGGYFFRPLAAQLGVADDELSAAIWELVWAGRLGNDTLAPLRALLGQGRTTHRSRPQAPARGRYGRLGGGRPSLPRAPLPLRTGPPEAAGRWSALPTPEPDPTARAVARAEVLLDRYGVVTRGSVMAEDAAGGFSAVYRVLATAEESGRVRRGYFVEGLGAAQFGGVGAVDRLRSQARPLEGGPAGGPALVLASADPANPYGAALAWPPRPDAGDGHGHLPGRKSGALVVLLDGRLVLYVERGGRTLLSWSEDPSLLEPAAVALAGAVHAGALGKLTVERVDGESVLGSDHPLARALASAGFGLTPRGLRLRR